MTASRTHPNPRVAATLIAVCVSLVACGVMTQPPPSGSNAAATETNAVTPATTPGLPGTTPPPAAVPPEITRITLAGGAWSGGDLAMITQVFRPPGAGPFPVIVYSHGRAADAPGRIRLAQPVPAVQVQYWLAKGFAVVAPIRSGYGATGGPDLEQNGVRFDSAGHCAARPDYRGTATATTRAVQATLDWLSGQNWADRQSVILVGSSAGGFGAAAAAATSPAGVIAYINFAGGTGGNPDRAPGRSCDPEQIAGLYQEFGHRTSIPNLWIYAENDLYWGSLVPKAWHAGFAAGGSRTGFIQVPPVQNADGHTLARQASRLWAPYVDVFLDSIGRVAAKP